MNSAVHDSTAWSAEPRVSTVHGWTVRAYRSVPSTNLIAATLPAWTAVRADIQTSGRGRFQRSWVSDEGGLWLSAVVPLGNRGAVRALPLAVGLAVCDALRESGVHHLRMRWPNDILVYGRKLAGLLIDQFAPDRAVAGIGINAHNHPENRDERLRHHTVRLADLLPGAPPVDELAEHILQHLRRVMNELESGIGAGTDSPGLAGLLPRVNALWGEPRRVELDLDGVLRRGIFTGVDHEGRLLLADENGAMAAYDASQVRHLTEL